MGYKISGYYDPSNVQRDTGGSGDGRFITRVPGPDRPLICKFVPNPKTGLATIKIAYYPHRVGPSDQDVRFHPSLKSLGMIESAPENDKYWEIVKQYSAAKKEGAAGDVLQALLAKKKSFEAKELEWVYILEPNSTTIKCLKLTRDLSNQLFGRDKTEYRPAVPSLEKAMAREGRHPFNLEIQEGWVRIYKTGEKLATKYVIEQYMDKKEGNINGKKVYYDEPFTCAVPEKLLTEEIDEAELPDPVEYEKRYAFTLDETIEFVNSQATIIPERLMKKTRDATPSDTEAKSEGTPPSTDNLDDVPF